MLRICSVLLAFGLCSSHAWAGVAVDLSYGQSMSGKINAGKNLPLHQQTFGIGVDYVGDMNRGLLGGGMERFSLGMGLYTAQVGYKADDISSNGGNFFLTARTGWLLLVSNKTWLMQLTPEFILFSQMSVVSYSQTTFDGERFQSASLSTFGGSGSVRLPLYIGKKTNWKVGRADLFLGGSLSTLLQSFSKRKDIVVANSPSTGKVSSIEKSRTGNYQLQAFSISFHLTFIL